MPSLTGRLRARSLASAALVVATMIMVPASAGAEPEPTQPPASTARPIAPTTVTLITGDRVGLVPRPDGTPQVVIGADSGTSSDYLIRHDGKRIEVIPRDVAELVPWLLDPALFDVAGLAEMGYDDQHSPAIPLIVGRAPGVRSLAIDPTLQPEVTLPSIDATAYSLSKRQAHQFGDRLTALAARPGRAERPLAAATLGGIGRIWLDRQVTAVDGPALDVSPAPARTAAERSAPAPATGLDGYLTQVGAPAAWARGLDGAGVTIAVVDSGVDGDHPDLSGKVTAAQNFTDSPSTDDVDGHGTHVASLAAGTGAAAAGARRGIAPSAAIISGKVLGDNGVGQESWAIAGMEWAVAQGADIVNLSLGSTAGAEDDPVVLALDELTRTSGTLFVAAAGNYGWNGWVPETVTSPGTAASALTVGAVDEHDSTPGFSGAGPTRGSYRAKPDVVAPGIDLLGARAGSRGDEPYIPMTGTSMATPLVAGAAALAMQLHPDWTWQQIKSVVTNTAAHTDDTPWTSGAGRLAIGALIDDPVTIAPNTISPGIIRYPSTAPVTTTVTLTNSGSEPRTYTAADTEVAPDDGTPAADDALVVNPTSVTIAPGAAATVGVTFDPGRVRPGYWHGMIEFTGPDGPTLRVPFATYDEPERYWLDLTVRDRLGRPYAGGVVPVQNTSTGGYQAAFLDDAGQARLRVAPGTYSAIPIITTDEPTGATVTVAGTPQLDVHADRTLTIDARTATRVRPPRIAGRQTVATEFSLNWNSLAPNGNGSGDLLAPPIDEVNAGRVFVAPSAEAPAAAFEAATRWRLTPVGRTTPNTPDAYELVFARNRLGGVPESLSRQEVGRLAKVTDHYYAPRPESSVLVGRTSSTPLTFGIVHRREVSAPRTETLWATADPQVQWGYETSWLDEGPMQLSTFGFQPYRPKERVTHHFRRAAHVGAFPGNVFQAPEYMSLAVGFDDGVMTGAIPWERLGSASTTLYRDGKLVRTEPGPGGIFQVPGEAADYRLLSDIEVVGGSRTTTDWRFRSAANTDPNPADAVPPLLSVDYAPSTNQLGVAAVGRRLDFDLRLAHLPGADATEQIDALTLAWSSNGNAWKAAKIRRTGPMSFAASINGNDLVGGTTVSLRLTARDADGNAMEQTVRGFIPVR